MCVVSMISDHYRDKWKWPEPQQTTPWQDLNLVTITRADWQEYQELKRKAAEYDKRTNQPDCVKPDIEEWEKKIEAYLKKKGIIK